MVLPYSICVFLLTGKDVLSSVFSDPWFYIDRSFYQPIMKAQIFDNNHTNLVVGTTRNWVF
jgi:hypothetical protein